MTAATRERIIEATLTLIAEQGLSAVTMVAVAQRAGVARATLYNHYADVPAILADATAVHNEQAIAGLREALSVVASPTAAVEQLVRYVASISIHGHTLGGHHGLPPELHEQLALFDTELDTHINRALTDGVAQGEFRARLDVEVSTTLLRHLLAGVSQLVAATPSDAARITAEATATVQAALAVQQPKDLATEGERA